MKAKWSRSWNSSHLPRKQRKYRANAPLHIMRRFLSACLEKGLRATVRKRSLPIRKGDEVKVMRGDHRGHMGKVESIDTKRAKVYIEKLKAKKVGGTEVPLPVSSSNLMIIKLNLDDAKRVGGIEKKKTVKAPAKAPKAPRVEQPEKAEANKAPVKASKPKTVRKAAPKKK